MKHKNHKFNGWVPIAIVALGVVLFFFEGRAAIPASEHRLERILIYFLLLGLAALWSRSRFMSDLLQSIDAAKELNDQDSKAATTD